MPFEMEDKRENWFRELDELVSRAPPGLRVAMFVAFGLEEKLLPDSKLMTIANFKSFKAAVRFVKACLVRYEQQGVERFKGLGKG